MSSPSAANQPDNISAYVKWLAEERGVEISLRNETHYRSLVPRAQRDMRESELWKTLLRRLPEFNDEYYVSTGYQLLAAPMFELQSKGYESFLLKTFRKNILENSNWPEPPMRGWFLPDNWYSRINDILRTTVVVKYLDGVEFLAGMIRSLCDDHSVICQVDLEARESGYYAAHLYVQHEFEVPKLNWNTEVIPMWTEIQITTQIKETILRLTHKFYEERRERIRSPDTKWQWNYKSDEFAASYLGHILHYVEGMIMEIRDKQGET